MHRVFNFAAGPSALPIEVLKTIHEELFDWKGMGASVLEISHRSKQFTETIEETGELIKELYGINSDYEVLFVQGGGHLQFAMIPLNLQFLGRGAYAVNGVWSAKAFKEASKISQAGIAAQVEKRVPLEEELKTEGAGFLYYCSNETVNGIQYHYVPKSKCVLACDMSSDFLSKPVDVSKYGVIFAGAQKNFGPAGLTVVIVRKDLLGKCGESTPTMLDYQTYAKSLSMFNTPPVFSIYVANLVAKWIKKQGGVEEMYRRSLLKSELLYSAIDQSGGFYYNDVKKEDRSLMNVVFNLKNPELEQEFIESAKKEDLFNVKGHRIVGGMRASIYNAVSVEGTQKLADFMKRFAIEHG